jgi:hypothetical protein
MSAAKKGKRLRPGELDGQVLAYMRKHMNDGPLTASAMLLNSAERTVLGLSWFCALHMLQPSDQRKVLVMDDPTAGFDNANTAGFTSTLRAFTRLLRPEQVVIATHDERVAAMLAEELAGVDGWPESVVRVRFSRDANDCSVASQEWARDGERQVSRDSELL